MVYLKTCTLFSLPASLEDSKRLCKLDIMYKNNYITNHYAKISVYTANTSVSSQTLNWNCIADKFQLKSLKHPYCGIMMYRIHKSHTLMHVVVPSLNLPRFGEIDQLNGLTPVSTNLLFRIESFPLSLSGVPCL